MLLVMRLKVSNVCDTRLRSSMRNCLPYNSYIHYFTNHIMRLSSLGAGADSPIFNQLDLILKFLGLSLCLKDNTSGQQTILCTLNNLFSFLVAKGDITLSDAEAAVIVPYVVEKSGNAKGRSQPLYAELLSNVFELFACTKFGLLCVNVVDSSKNQKVSERRRRPQLS